MKKTTLTLIFVAIAAASVNLSTFADEKINLAQNNNINVSFEYIPDAGMQYLVQVQISFSGQKTVFNLTPRAPYKVLTKIPADMVIERAIGYSDLTPTRNAFLCSVPDNLNYTATIYVSVDANEKTCKLSNTR